MNAGDFDLTPALALRKLAVLFESGKSEECAILLRRLADVSLDTILELLPVEVLHDGIPASLPVLEAIYLKVISDLFCCPSQTLFKLNIHFSSVSQQALTR